ncbi:mitotic check point protein [Pestalotiopsis sp. NC0098]|nr:mitotic check point protein [Pestalotiopsis sp. NC0098]
MPSPTRESNPTHAPSLATELHAPPSPRTHRQLRKLQSAHNLGAASRLSSSLSSSTSSASLISQARFKELQGRDASPTRRVVSNRSPTGRHRSNSDLTSPASLLNAGAMAVRQRFAMSTTSAAADAVSLERLLRDGPPDDSDIPSALESARLKVLDQGIKSDSDGMSSVRIYVWLIFLNAPVLETDEYLALIHRSASPAYAKIRNDTFRTLTTDPLFRRRVSEASLIRLLNAIAWKLHDAKELRRLRTGRQSLPCTDSSGGSRPSTANTNTSSPAAKNRARALTLTTEGDVEVNTVEPGTYVQGMNVLAAPFLYAARSEVEAFSAFHRLLTKEVPGYIRGAMTGVHHGLELVDKVLAIVDVRLHLHLVNKGLSAKIYAFPSVLTLCACTPPLPEVLRLWDFLFAYGPHLNIVCIVAQLVMMRHDLLNSSSPNKLLRSFPALVAEDIKKTALALVNRLPDDVYDEIVKHAQ